MKDLPSAFWAAIFIMAACGIAIVVLYCPAPENVKQNVLTIASSVVTGAFGYIQGKREGAESHPPPTTPPPTQPPA